MNREIKFRAWDTKNKFMLDSSYGNWISFDGIPYGEPDSKYNTPHIEVEKDVNLILMQYTGLKDKHGKEIYEGDIIKIASTGDIKKIFYHKCSFGIDLGNNVFAPIYWHEDIEVIGNIYENPDLLP